MNDPDHNWVAESTTRTLTVFAVFCLIVFAALLTGCTTCPSEQCPAFPNGMARP